MNLNDIRAVVMDMDGVLWRGDEPLPGLVPFFEMLRSKNLPFALATNNSSKSPADYIGKLERMGVAGLTIRQIITSGTVTMSYLQENFPPGSPLHVLGGDGLRRVITEGSFALGDEGVSAVVVGLDPQLTYEKLRRAALLIRAGAAFIATNADATIPSPDGLAPGAGSIVAALRTATDCEPLVIGKPGRPMFEAAVRLLGTSAEQTLMIGDRLTTDIHGAAQAGLRTALVLTGVSTRAEAAASPVQPGGIYDDLPALLAAWG